MLQTEQWTMWPEQQLLPSERIHYVLNPVWKPASNLNLLETLCPVRAVDYEWDSLCLESCVAACLSNLNLLGNFLPRLHTASRIFLTHILKLNFPSSFSTLSQK